MWVQRTLAQACIWPATRGINGNSTSQSSRISIKDNLPTSESRPFHALSTLSCKRQPNPRPACGRANTARLLADTTICLGLEAPQWTVKGSMCRLMQQHDCDIIEPQSPPSTAPTDILQKTSKRSPPAGSFSVSDSRPVTVCMLCLSNPPRLAVRAPLDQLFPDPTH